MSYTTKLFPRNKPHDFPPPSMWLTWMAYNKTDKTEPGVVDQSVGQVRHHFSLARAKKHVGSYDYGYNDKFQYRWAIFEWTGEKYAQRFQGEAGDPRSTHPLFSRAIKAADPHQELPADELEEALQSIARAARVRV